MKTLIITMGNLTAESPGSATMVYPVHLFFDDGQSDWMTKPLATSQIPEDLSLLNPPLDPTNKPIEGGKIRDAFLKENNPTPLFGAFGSYLHQLLFQGAVAQEWNRLHGLYPREVKGQSEGLRTILNITPDNLRWLPWELLYEAPLPLFFDSANPFVRGTLDNRLPVKSFTWPIHVLIIVGSVANDAAVNAEQEIEAIKYAFIKSPVPIDWEICYRPTKAELSATIAKFKPQILHFIGHGKEINGYAFLELTDKKGVAPREEWTVQDVTIDLLNWQPRLAFINACRTSSSAGQRNSWDIAKAFSAAKVPAVVGMQADIRGDAAAAFSGKFYESLVNDLPIDRALSEARAAVRNLPTITVRRRDWALATLHLRQMPAQILEMQPEIDAQLSNKFKRDSKLQETNDFVDRRPQRRSLWYGVDPTADHNDPTGMLIVVGDEVRVGKTSLVQASLKLCALRRRTVSYVDMGDPKTKDFVEILQIIRQGDPQSNSVICLPLPAGPFANFDKEYGALLNTADAAKKLAADNNLCEHFFTAYKAALESIAASGSLIIALDHLNVEWELFKSILVPKLLLPIAQNQLKNCHLILVVSATDLRDRLPKDLKDNARIVELRTWETKEEFVPLAQEICLFNDVILDENVRQVIEWTSKSLKPGWGPITLRTLVNLAKQFQDRI